MADKVAKMYGGEVTLEFKDSRHVYVWQEKELPVPGVTSILGNLNKPALVGWAANQAAFYVRDNYSEGMGGAEVAALCEEARGAHRRFAKDAADIGTIVHKFAEDFMTALMAKEPVPPFPEDPIAQKACEAFSEWTYENKVEPLQLERMILSREFYFAGTCDFFGRINDKLVAVDYKTSSGIYPEMVLQVNGAYTLALEEETGVELDGSYIIRLDKKTGDFHPYFMERSTLHQSAFANLVDLDKQIKRIKAEMKGKK